jgi:glycosyltransferase involved in cell wall biosynthesis
LKILQITASYKPAFIYGGPIYSVAALCESLNVESSKFKGESDGNVGSSKSKVESETLVEVYTTLANGKEELPYQNGESRMVDGVKVFYFKRLTKDHSHFSPSLLWKLWKNAKQFDVIHIHSWWNLVSMGAVVICLIKGIKPIISPRGMLGDYTFSRGKSIYHQLLGKHLLKQCNFHATTNMEAKEIAAQVFNGQVEIVDLMLERWKVESGKSKVQIEYKEENKSQRVKRSLNGAPSPSERAGVRLREIFVIHNIVNLPEELPVKTRVFDGTLNLIFLSRIHHKKGIELLLESLAKVDFPFSLTIVGEGKKVYVESLKLKVESLGLSQNIKWIGSVFGDEKYELLAIHDAFVLPSYNENFANVIIESIAVGTPVLISDKVGLKDYVLKNNFGLVFKLEELKERLDETYSLLNEGKLVFNMESFKSQQSLIGSYMEMYSQL